MKKHENGYRAYISEGPEPFSQLRRLGTVRQVFNQNDRFAALFCGPSPTLALCALEYGDVDPFFLEVLFVLLDQVRFSQGQANGHIALSMG